MTHIYSIYKIRGEKKQFFLFSIYSTSKNHEIIKRKRFYTLLVGSSVWRIKPKGFCSNNPNLTQHLFGGINTRTKLWNYCFLFSLFFLAKIRTLQI